MLVLALPACNDERVRELGYTLSQQQPPQVDPDGVGAPPDDGCETFSELITADSVTRAVAADLATAASDARPFLRYASLANLLDGQRCTVVDRSRLALSKVLNAVSSEPDLVIPAAVDGGSHPLLFRIDLRDYGLDREIPLDGATHRDGWEAIVASSRYSIAFGGEDGAFLARETGTSTPWLSVDAIVEAVSSADLYYALANVPPTLGELRQRAGLSAELDPFGDGLPRVATSRSRVLRAQGNLRAIDRYATPNGTYWEALQIDASQLLADPLRIQPDAQRLIMFNLPNGLFAFAVMDAAGNRQGSAELLLDTNRADFTGTVLTSCTNCHASGLIPATDELRPAVLGNPDLFTAEEVAAYSSGPDEVERATLFETDTQRYLDALEGAGVASEGGDPIAGLAVEVEQEVSAEVAAGDLFVTRETLRARLSELPPELLPLGVGLLVSRAQLGAAYARAFCTLHANDANPPAAATCE